MSGTRRTGQEKARLLRDFERSGQSAAAFCRQRGVSYQTLANRRRAAADLPPPEQAPAFPGFQLGAARHRSAPAAARSSKPEPGGGIILRIHPARPARP